MSRIINIIVFVSCLIILVNIGIAGTSVTIKLSHDFEELEDTYISVCLSYHADANGPYSGNVNDVIMFDSFGTNINPAGVVTYEWDFGDDITGTGKYPTHSYSEQGVYYVTLTVINGNEEVYKDITPVYIERLGDHLVPDGGCNYYAEIDEPILFDGSQSVSKGADIVEWFWDFGDGASAYGTKVSHSYKEERVYIVTLNIKDSDGFTRHDVLHADIGRSYSSEEDFFHNCSGAMQNVLDILLNKPYSPTRLLCNLLDAKIYTKCNEIEKYTDLKGFSPLPVEIDVNDDGTKDIKANDLQFFDTKWSTSMFDDNSRVWMQFETRLSEVRNLPESTIQDDDDFIVCLQLDFNIIADELDLDDTITRIGYHSPAGEEMPDTITLTHILRPYLLFRLFNFVNDHTQGVETNAVYNEISKQSLDTPLEGTSRNNEEISCSRTTITKTSGTSWSGEVEKLEGEAQYTGGAQLYASEGSGNEYWPEYGLRIQSSGGGSFSLVTIFLNSGASSKTTIKITYGSSTSSIMYKRLKVGGILNHATVFEIPGNEATLSITREKNSDITELSTDFSFSGELFRGIGWSDEGVYLNVLGKFEASLLNFYFDNPDCIFTLEEISLSTSGRFDLNFEDGVKLSLGGNAGFILRDLLFISKEGSGFQGEIIGTLNLDVGSSVHVALAQGVLDVGFNGELVLSSDCEFKVNEETVTVSGLFSLDSYGVIKFTWDTNQFTIDLDAGLSLEISNLNFEVGNLVANASLIEIEASGKFDIIWDTGNNEVTITSGSGASLFLRDVEITIYNGNSLIIKIIGSLEVQANGEITFGPDVFKASFTGIFDLNTGVEFEINGESIKVGGTFEFIGGNGEIIFSWENDDFSLEITGSPSLSVDNLYFEIGFDTGDLIVYSDLVEIGVNGEFNVVSNNSEVTISGDASAFLAVENLNITITVGDPDLNIQIIGWFEVQADGWITFGPGVFKAGFDGELDLGAQTQFIVNGEGITVGGVFYLTGTNGEISFLWDDGNFILDVSGSADLSVTDFYFKVDDVDLKITAEELGIGISGQLLIDWDTGTNEIIISSGGTGVSFGLTDLYVNYADILTVQIIGSLEVEANGYLKFGDDLFEVNFSGTLDLGTQTQFIINGEGITVGGQYELSSGNGQIGFTWDSATQEFTFYVSGSPSVSVSNLYFEAGDITVEAENIEIGANGEFNLDWNTGTKEIKISGGEGVSLVIGNVSFTYGTIIDASITGSLDIQAEGDLILAPGVLEASFSGTLDFGTSCIFEINSDSLTVGGKFTLSNGNGDISFSWSDTQLNLDFSGSSTLTVTDFYFEAEDLTVTGDEVEIEVSGEFDVSLDTGNNEVTISSGDSGISLYIENVDIIYGTTLEIEIIGSFELEANGWLTFGDGVFEAGFTGLLDLGVSTQFIINGDGITVGGQFDLGFEDGEISFTWTNEEFSLTMSGSSSLTVTDLYFEAEISGETLTINAGEVGIGVNGDFSLDWDTVNNEVTFSSDAGVYLLVADVDFSYGNSIDVSIIGEFSIQANGYITLGDGVFKAGFTGQIDLGGTAGYVEFEINSDNVKIGGDFTSSGTGEIAITWSNVELSFDASGNIVVLIIGLYFEIESLKIDADSANVGLNGDFTIISDKTNKKFEIDGDVTFGFGDLNVYIDNNGWYQICSVLNLYVGGGGYVLVDSGSNDKIELKFNGQLNLANLYVTPPTNWNFDLSIGSTTLSSSAEASIKIEKDPQTGEGKFALNALSGGISGQIINFDSYVLIGSKDLQIDFNNFQISGKLSLLLDDTNDDIQLSADGTITLTGFNAEYGTFEISADIEFDGNGNIVTEWTENTLDIDADVDFVWDIWLNSPSIGEWEALGNLEGDVEINAIWQTGSGSAEVVINEPGLFHNLEIIHDSLSFSLADICLSPGTITFQWQYNDNQNTGYFLIDSEFTQNICTLNLAVITWGTKTISFGWPELKPGDFKFTWDIPNHELTINNGIQNLGPTLTYEDTSQDLDLSVNIGNLQDDYSKTMTLKWYEQNGQVIGIYLDTSNTYLAQLLKVEFIKGTSGNNGKRIIVYGLQCDQFYIKKEGDKFVWDGNIYLANHIVFSKLKNNEWKDLDAQWNLQGQEKWIKFERDPDFDLKIKLSSVDILGFTFTSEINLMNAEYIEIKWDIGVIGQISIDTDWEYIASINLVVGPDYGIGLDLTVNSLRAQNWRVEWTAWPPAEWNVITYGSIQGVGINIDVYYNGEWHHVWPWS